MKRILLLVLALAGITGGQAMAADRPTFTATFEPGVTYLRIHKGTTDGLKNDYRGRDATKGVVRDVQEREVGTFETVYADDFEAVVRIASFAEGKSLADVDHVAMPGLKIGFLPFKLEPSGNYFRIDKGRNDLDPRRPQARCEGPALSRRRGARRHLHGRRGRADREPRIRHAVRTGRLRQGREDG